MPSKIYPTPSRTTSSLGSDTPFSSLIIPNPGLASIVPLAVIPFAKAFGLGNPPLTTVFIVIVLDDGIDLIAEAT